MNRILFCILIFGINSISMADKNWPEFRGPNHNGYVKAENLPVKWSESENVVWKTAIHDRGWSTPVILDDQIWITTATKEGTENYILCVDLASGQIIRDIKLFENESPQRIHYFNSYATPTCAIEKGSVYAHFGTFGTACLDTKSGEVKWSRNDLKCEHMQGPASSPFLYKDKLILHLEGTVEQYIVALDKKTGKTLWRVDRPEKYYENQEPVYRKAYTSPIIIQVDGKDQMISPGSQLCSAFDPETGKEIWRVIYGHDSTISLPVLSDGLVMINTGYWGNEGIPELWAVKPDGQGDVTETHVKWKRTEAIPGVPTPAVWNDLLYLVEDKGTASCLDAKTGKVLWLRKFRNHYNASPVCTDSTVYFLNQKGLTTVVKTGKDFEVVSKNKLDGELWASPAVSGNALILRTDTHLYRIENKK